MSDLSYGFQTRIQAADLDAAIARVTAALQKEGFGVLATIDVKSTLEKKLGGTFRPYTILGACNPSLAQSAISAEPHIGLLLPCNVLVQELDSGDINVSIADPKAMFTVVDNPALAPVAEEADRRLRRVIDELGAAS